MTNLHKSQANSAGLIRQYSDIANQARNDELNRQIAEFVAKGGKITVIEPPKPEFNKPKKTRKQTILMVKKMLNAGSVTSDSYTAINPAMPIHECMDIIRQKEGWNIRRSCGVNGVEFHRYIDMRKGEK